VLWILVFLLGLAMRKADCSYSHCRYSCDVFCDTSCSGHVTGTVKLGAYRNSCSPAIDVLLLTASVQQYVFRSAIVGSSISVHRLGLYLNALCFQLSPSNKRISPLNVGSIIKLMKGKALRKHSLYQKTAALVLLKPFISSNE